MVVIDGIQLLLVGYDALYEALYQGLRIRVEVDLVVRSMRRVEDMAELLVCLPRAFEDADRLPIFESDSNSLIVPILPQPMTTASEARIRSRSRPL